MISLDIKRDNSPGKIAIVFKNVVVYVKVSVLITKNKTFGVICEKFNGIITKNFLKNPLRRRSVHQLVVGIE